MTTKLKTFSFGVEYQDVLEHLKYIKSTYGNESRYIAELIRKDMYKDIHKESIDDKIKRLIGEYMKTNHDKHQNVSEEKIAEAVKGLFE
jgi:hypothetical protein